MASSFWHFYFDGVKSTNYKICMVDFNSHEIVKYIGGSHNISIEKDTSYNGQHFYKETERTSDDIIIQLARTDRKPWRVDNILEVTEWLFKENFCKFQPMDFDSQGYNIVYYLKAIDIKKNFTPNMEGFLEITFKSYDGYTYIVPSNSITLSSNSSKTVNNMSNVNKKYLPKIKVVGSGNITISNITNGDILTLNGLSNDEQIIIDGKKEIRKLCEFGVNLDERIGDGFYFLKSIKLLQYIFDNPELLEGDANEKIEIKK